MSQTPDLSLVIPTFRRPELLGRLLDSLLVQTAGVDRFEVIVVDNQPEGPHPATQALCQDQRYSSLALVYLHQPEPGSSPARNLGIRHARAPLLGFIDDDETLRRDWVEQALRIFTNAAPDLFGGPCLPYYDSPKPAWFRDEYLTLAPWAEARWLKASEYLAGGNLAVRKGVFDRMGDYPTSLGRIGNNLEYGEETDLQNRAAATGAHSYYDPELVIYHYTHPDRMRAGWFLSSAWYHGKAKARISSAKDTSRRPGWRILLSSFRDLAPKFIQIAGLALASLLRSRKKYPYLQNYWVEEIVPRVSGLSTSIYHTRFLLQKSAPRGQDRKVLHA